MDLCDAKTPEEIDRAIAEAYPDEIEIEPGKIAKYDPKHGQWVYIGPDGEEIIVQV